MTKQQYSKGFSAVELLITLFIAATFLMSGYQLYGLIIREGGDARAQARANNIAYDYLQKYKDTVTNPCTASTLVDGEDVSSEGLYNATVTVTASCPYNDIVSPTPVDSLTKIEVELTYDSPAKVVKHATYVTP